MPELQNDMHALILTMLAFSKTCQTASLTTRPSCLHWSGDSGSSSLFTCDVNLFHKYHKHSKKVVGPAEHPNATNGNPQGELQSLVDEAVPPTNQYEDLLYPHPMAKWG
eukprot:jgi/Psemu1/16264/gm1.16264_g